MNLRRFTAQCLPCFPTERIAHLGTADRCIHPPGRNEMIAITPQKIFSKEVAQNRPPHFPARTSLSTRNRFTPNFRGWRLDEFSIFARPPPRGDSHTPPRREAFRSSGRRRADATSEPTLTRVSSSSSGQLASRHA